MATSPPLQQTGTLVTDITLYRQLVGVLQYLIITRPDISFAVNKICQFIHKPTTDHFIAAKRIPRYLNFTPNHGVMILKSLDFSLQVFADSDWAGNVDHRSNGGFCI